MRCIKKPAKRDIEINERFAQRRIVRLSLSGLWFETTIALRLPCAGGGRVLAAERAILRIACVVKNPSDGVPEGTVLAAERAMLRIACIALWTCTTTMKRDECTLLPSVYTYRPSFFPPNGHIRAGTLEPPSRRSPSPGICRSRRCS